MNKLLLVYAAVIFVIAVVVFVISELNKNAEEEPEIFRWAKLFSFVLLVLAIGCLIAAF